MIIEAHQAREVFDRDQGDFNGCGLNLCNGLRRYPCDRSEGEVYPLHPLP
jgi:hypothetical protein